VGAVSERLQPHRTSRAERPGGVQPRRAAHRHAARRALVRRRAAARRGADHRNGTAVGGARSAARAGAM
jgi:hypothetical protein